MVKYKSILTFPWENKRFEQEHTALDLRDLYRSGRTIVKSARRHGYPVSFRVFDGETGEPLLKFYCRDGRPIQNGYVCRLSQFCKYGGTKGMWL